MIRRFVGLGSLRIEGATLHSSAVPDVLTHVFCLMFVRNPSDAALYPAILQTTNATFSATEPSCGSTHDLAQSNEVERGGIERASHIPRNPREQ
jgi:hypothetical protein